ncbi:ABC transporter permease [Nocardiopsis composta]|uniref:Peptide/nickel transport system permease protein n=1 Tax=Nocardiopsis composta TaxID=157465 RepID=A0A7W8QKL9_9ACTN|nr:ABC transporter permease [Nocardiopsis composta]MBB5432178.1 peptide/nickel transport system permease protein [Nocardiopsis composta]
MSPAAGYLLRRLVGGLCLLVAASSCAYLLCAAVLDPRGNYQAMSPPPPPEAVARMLAENNLDPGAPLAERYLVWASGAVTGDLGRTWDGREVSEELVLRAGASLRLLAAGAVAGAVGGVAAGAWAGARGGRWDTAAAAGAALLVSVPPIVVALVLQALAIALNQAAGGVLLPAVGEPDAEAPPGERAAHMILPTLALALPLAAVFSRYQRALMAEEAGSDYVRTARAKGLRRGTALRRHALRSCLVPTAAYFAYTTAALFTGAVFAEKVFGRHGAGEMLIDAIEAGDANAAAAVCVFGALCVTVAGFAADAVRAALDPRVRA